MVIILNNNMVIILKTMLFRENIGEMVLETHLAKKLIKLCEQILRLKEQPS